jgi:hypothetical protein
VPLKEGSRTCPFCGYNEAQIIVHNPVAVERVNGQLVAVAEPKVKVIADPTDLDALRELRVVLVETEGRLMGAAEAAARLSAVNLTNRGVFGRFAEVMDLMGTPGDFVIRVGSPLVAVGLRQVVHALIGEIDSVLMRYEEEMKK